jgi:hypothetical protein
MPSMSADEIIEKAKLCYSIDLITEAQLERVIQQAEREPGYTAILDLPLPWTIENGVRLRKQAERAHRHHWWNRRRATA